ncbi:three component ABC system middle component [Lentibacillus daqui]|uniref:three component ABC system middle component n=1 Tax=Lentibacillus daqui TaxID=2911514 RepID=UPI0022B13881|nr:three component ABC system middle component [Lentibacillus daqui]
MISTDTYSATNPPLCSLILWSFLNGFEEVKKEGCEFPILFLPLPLVLSKPIRNNFDGTNTSTGLLTWISRNPSAIIDIAQRIEVTQDITREAILFGTTNKIFYFDDEGLIFFNKSGIKVSKIYTEEHFEESRKTLTVAKKLGSWCGQLESTKTIYNVLGVSL